MKAKGRGHVLTEAIQCWQGKSQSDPFHELFSQTFHLAFSLLFVFEAFDLTHKN
jgi:hypothetical protein